MLVYAKIKSVQKKIASLEKGIAIGFVPTMGALHKGHLSLIEKAKKENDFVVVSIFVNPTQFDKQEDLINYPKTLEADLSLLRIVNCDLVFTPSAQEIYKTEIQSESFSFDGLENQMEGRFRKGHFDGVGTIVKRLFEIVKPHRAYFGEKDFQQLQIIRKLVQKYDIPVEIVAGAIYRESDGLAMSSRNSRLSTAQRNAAPFIFSTLRKLKELINSKNIPELNQWVANEFEKQALLKLEYFEIASEETLQTLQERSPNEPCRAFIAVFAGNIRLIDNIRL